MTTPRPSSWSKPSRACRIELRRSRQLAVALVFLGLLGLPSWWGSDAPRAVAIPAMLLGLVAACAMARRELARPSVSIRLKGEAAQVDGRDVLDFQAAWRGPLLGLAWKADGRTVRRLAFPDALDAAARRELRLWVLRRREDAPAAAVAP